MATLIDIFRIAADKRSSLSEVTDACRLFNGVGDGIPGVTLDRFGDRYQLQFFSADAVKSYEQIKKSVLDLFQPEFLVAKFRTDPSGRSLEHPRMDVVAGSAEFARGTVREGKARFYVAAENLFTHDNLRGLPIDPEVVSGVSMFNSGNYNSGRTGVGTPAMKNISVGIQLNF